MFLAAVLLFCWLPLEDVVPFESSGEAAAILEGFRRVKVAEGRSGEEGTAAAAADGASIEIGVGGFRQVEVLGAS